MKRVVYFICLTAFSLAISCSRSPEYDSQGAFEKSVVSAEMASPDLPPVSPGDRASSRDAAGNKPAYSAKLIKTGSIGISTPDLEKTRSLVYSLVKQCGGAVTSELFSKDYGFTYYELTISVPAVRFELFQQLMDSSKLNISAREFSSEDVALKYIDDSTRLENKKRLEQKYLSLLARTSEMKSILEIEDKLEEIRSDIEVRQGQFNALKNKIAFSTIKIRINKEIHYTSWEDQNKFSTRLLNGLSNGWDGLKSFAVYLLSVWPAWFILAILFWVINRNRKKKKSRKAV